jgi:hypothetical protein
MLSAHKSLLSLLNSFYDGLVTTFFLFLSSFFTAIFGDSSSESLSLFDSTEERLLELFVISTAFLTGFAKAVEVLVGLAA